MRLTYTHHGPSTGTRPGWDCRRQGHLWANPPGPLTKVWLWLGGRQTCPGCGTGRKISR